MGMSWAQHNNLHQVEVRKDVSKRQHGMQMVHFMAMRQLTRMVPPASWMPSTTFLVSTTGLCRLS